MADDPLRELFGAPASDPFTDLFGQPHGLTTGIPSQAGPLESAIEGKSPEEAAAEAHREEALKQAATTPGDGLDNIERRQRDTAHQEKLDNESLLTVGGKSLEGLPARVQQWLGGLLESVGEFPAQTPELVMGTIFGPNPGVATMTGSIMNALPLYKKALDKAGENPVTTKGREVAGLGTEALKEIDPAYSPGSRNDFAFQLFNSFQDLFGAAAVTVATKNPEAGAALIGAEVFGQQYDQSRQQGRTPQQALQDAAFNGAAEMLGENIPLGIIMKPGGKFLTKTLKTAGAEGLQELVTQVLQSGYDKAVLDPNMPWGEVVRQVEQAGLIGAIAGGATSAALHPFTREAPELTTQSRPDEQPGVDDLGRAPGPRAPEHGRTYNVADAIAELGMTPEEAQSFVSSGKDPRGKIDAMKGAGFTPEMTPEDRSSDIPDSVIVQGKDLLGSALEEFNAPVESHLKAARLPADILDGLIKRGIPEHIARGVAAGTIAEADGNPLAVNKDSGAFGIGQWLGSRLQELQRRYGASPNLDQQLDFLVHELNGGDQGGRAVLGASDETSALNAYIHDFMRPGTAGAASDMQRGLAALGRSSEAIASQAGTGTGTDETDQSGGDQPSEAALTVEGTLAQAGLSDSLGADVTSFQPQQRLDVTRNGETVPGTVQEVYGEGDRQGVKVALDNGETFDELVKAARDYGAKLTHPVDSVGHVFGPEKRTTKVEVPEAAQPVHYAGEKIDEEYTAFHPDTGTLGIARAEMPQIKQEYRGAFVNYAEARGITHEADVVPASSLKPTQAEFAPSKVESFIKRDAGDRSVLVSSDGYVLDGHHQWLASLNKNADVRVIRLNAPIRDLLPIAHDFPSATTSEGGAKPNAYADERGRFKIPEGETDHLAETFDGRPRVFVNEVGPDGQTDAERGRALTQEERDNLKAEEHTKFVRDDIRSVLDARAQMNKAMGRDEQRAFLKGVMEETGTSPAWAKSVEGVDLANKEQKVAYNKGRAAAVKELRSRGVAPIDKGPITEAEARKVAVDAVRDGRATAGNTGDVIYSFGQRVGGQKGPGMTPGKVNVEHRGTIYSFNEKEIRAEAAKTESTAPERATVGVDDRELGEIVTAFNDAQASMIEGDEELTHIFDKPEPAEIVRLQDKVRVYHKDHGWMTPKEAAAKIREWEDHAVKQGQDPEARSYNGDKIVLSLFDKSGEWSLPWEQAGYQVYRFDIQNDFTDFEGDGENPGDVNNFSHEFFADYFGDFEGKDVYAILAACPCTDFASSGARHFAAKDKDGRTVASVQLVHQTLATIEHFKPAVWALENPVGRIEKLGGLPPWRLSFDPNHMGETYTKKTLIWGRFNADLPIAPVEPVEGSKMHKQYGGKSLATKNARSVTPEGFAYSFFMANNAIDHQTMAIANKYDRLDRSKIERAVKAGVTEAQIDEAVQDHYYQDLNDEAANKAIDDLAYEARHRGAQVSQAKEDANSLGPAEPQTREEAEIALEGGRKVKMGATTYGIKESKHGWTVTTGYADIPGIESQLGGGLDQWTKQFAIKRAMEHIEPRLPKAKEPIADQPTEAPIGVAAAEALIEKARPHQEELAAWGGNWDADYGFINPGMKSAARIVEKVTKEGYESLDEIKDIARAGFKVENKNLATDLWVSAQRKFGAENVHDKGWKMVDGDYFDRKLIISWPDGTKAEIQIIPDALETFRHEGGGSAIYSQWRSTEPGPEKDALLRKMEEGYANAAAGTSWESFFNELKSANGKALEAAASESGAPGVVANPGAGRQIAAEDQTTAQALPETAPEATSRSSTSKSENPATATNVGSAGQAGNVAYGASNKIVSREKADIARAIIRDKLKNQLNSGFDPELLSAGMQLAAFHLEAGARSFGAFAVKLADDLGVKASSLKPYLAAWYNGARDMLEGHGFDVSDMDSPDVVRQRVAKLEVSEPVNDIGDNGGENGGTSTDQGSQEPDRTGDAREGATDSLGAEGERAVGQGAASESGAGPEQLRSGEEPGLEPRPASEPEPVASRSGQRNPAGTQQRGTRSAPSSRRVRNTVRGTNYSARPGDLARTGSWKDAAERNLDIIELVNRLEAEGRPATPEEQGILAKWVGWGSSEIRNNLFRYVDRRTMTINEPSYAGEWSDIIKRARELIKGKDLETALQSVQYAHYTSEGVVRAMWDAFGRMGFEGGQVLEPGMGIGHFFTAAPTSVAEHSTYTGIELDQFSAKVAKYLLPQENVIQGDYTKQAFPDGFFDAAIGNPPFAATKVLDDPAYKKMRLSLHNYFFVKTLDKVRPGGLVAFITSRYTMDAIDPKQRQFMADRADLVGAIRLPQTAFKQNAGTDVVTDVLFFQRRMPGAEPGGVDWLNIKGVTVDGQKVNINSYFAAHPEMVLGKHKIHRGMYRDNDLTVEAYASKGSIEKQFAEATGRLPENIYTAQPKANAESIQAKSFERDFAPASSKEGGIYVKDGKVLMVDRGSGIPVEAAIDNLKPADHAWLKGYVSLRDKLKDAQRAQLQDSPDWETHLNALRKEYAAFTKKNGRIKEFTAYERTTKDDSGEETTLVYRRFKWDRLLRDVEAPMVESLERITDAGDIEDGPFLKGRTLNKPVRPKIETVDDALAVTLDEIGKLDLGYIAKLVDKDEDEAVRLLGDRIYQAPSGEWQTSDEYLSGNVVQKLEEAQVAADANPELQRNVEALLKVQPAPLSYDKITVKLGAPWLRPETVTQFAEEVLGQRGVPISYEPANAHWNVEGSGSRWGRSNTSDYGTEQRSPLELLDAVLNNRSIKITSKVDGKEVVDANATAAANDAAKRIAERFRTWLWEDSARTSEYVETYNRGYNNIAERRFDGSHLTLPGLSALFKPHPHVKRAVWRIIQTGNTYLAHAVGAGKTAEQIISGMEQRRLGLIKKPMYAVPNHMLKQFSQEFLQLYPAANIMVADEQAFHTGNRRRFLAQASLNDPDAIILTHSSFGKIDTSPEMRERIVNDMVSELEDAAEEAKSEGAARHLVSRLEKQIEQLKRRFEGRTNSGKDKLLTFDEMGVDFLYIDEAHEFRKLDFATNRTAKGIDAAGSQRALDLFIKSQWLEQRNPGRSLALASGTPVTNTMAELYTVMKYMALKDLEKDHIAAFDAWANMFGEVAPGYERNAAGGYEIVERFSKFVNVPELMKRVRNFMDVLTSAQLGDLVTRPNIVGGGPQNAIVPQSQELKTFMERTLNERLETSRKWKPSKEQPGNPDPVINIITDARLSSIDMRFINSRLPSDPNSKLNTMISNIAAKHKEFANLTYTNKDGTKQPRKGGAQIIFSPVGLGEQVALNRGFDVRGWIDSELIRQGVKKSEIGWMSDANTHAKKEQLQKDVRSGKVRILIGSPKNMGTGLNVQDRLKVLHFLAPPWYPADVTQPHGRIERQGNQNGDIEIHWYATEGTYDSTGWGMVARKQKFIDDAMSGSDAVRTLEDISEVNMFEMAAALAAGDDRVIRIAELGGEVERLTRLKGAHSDTQRSLRSDISTLEKFELPRLEENQAALKRAQDARGAPYQQFSLEVGGQTFEKHGEGGEALKGKIIDIGNAKALERTEIGKLYGKFPVEIDATRHGDFQLFVNVGGTDIQAGRSFERGEDLDNVGVIRSLETAVQRITSELQDTARQISQAKGMLAKAQAKYGAPFTEEQQLSDAIAERNQLQAEMTARPEGSGEQGPLAYDTGVEVGARPFSVSAPLTPGTPEFEPENEERWQAANGTQVDAPGFLAQAKTGFQHFVEGWSRHYEHLPNKPRFASFKEQARKLEAAPEASYEKVVRHLSALVGKLTAKEYDVMKRKVVLDDLAWEADREHALPFGFTPSTLRQARANVDAIVNTMPKVVKAVRERKIANYELAKALVAAGVLRSEQIKNPAYYRHMVLDFARAQIEAAKSGGTIMVNGKPVRVRTPYWAARKGSALDINSNLLEAEADWMLKAHTDIATADTLNWLKDSDHNIRDELRKRAKAENDAGYSAAIANNPSARKEDGRLRSLMARGFDIVKQALAYDLNVPDELEGAADAILNGTKSDSSLALLSWMMDEKKPGFEGAALVLTGIGGRKKLMRTLLGDKYADAEDIKGLVKRYRPEGFTAWQPLEGQHLFTAKTVSESVLDMFVSKLSDEEYPGVEKSELERALTQIRPQLVVGRDRYTMVIPEEIAATLNDFGDKDSRNMFLHFVAGLLSKWKQYTLVNPRRWFRYNFNNMTGDLDAIIAGKASSLLKLPQAWRELRSAAKSDAYNEALERGVFQAGITRQEVPDIAQFKALRHLERKTSSLRPDKLAVQVVANLWNALKSSTQFRESLFRYAAYLKFKEEIDAGKAQSKIGYGASNPSLVEAITDPADRAALLSRELVGDYGNISVFGQRMRKYIMPFWSWPEMNTKRYFRLTANAFQGGYAKGIATGGGLGVALGVRTSASMFIRMSLVFTLINMWNRLLHGDDEDKLDDQQQRQLHLILGHDKDGHVYTLRMQGALSDVIDELGFSDTSEAFKDYEQGKGSLSGVLLATPKAIVNRVGPGNWNPLYMEPIQLALREKLWPDMFKPRTIHDRARDVAQVFSVENEYDALAHKPTSGYGQSWVQSLAYKRDPGEMAYNNTRDLVGQWMREKEGLEIGRADISPRGEALRDFKLAMKYGDVDAARAALTEYAKYGGTKRGLNQSVKGAAPLHPLPKRDRRAFYQSLNEHERDELIEAQRWYEETYLR